MLCNKQPPSERPLSLPTFFCRRLQSLSPASRSLRLSTSSSTLSAFYRGRALLDAAESERSPRLEMLEAVQQREKELEDLRAALQVGSLEEKRRRKFFSPLH